VAGRAIAWEVGDLPPAWGDGPLLRQVMFNLVENALKYTRPRAQAHIRIEGWEEGGETVYRVSDNGVGFDMTYVGKLFGVFQRLHRTEDFEGTGIGLALAKRVVERHGGEIEAEGVLDKGATFTFRIPRRDRAAETGAATNGRP
jgi:light-regulated signal transduction histidine kinase (bacteriophytochrome)